MTKNKAKPLPRLKSIDELVDFFDKHDMGDYWDSLPKAEFEVNIKTRKHVVAIDEKIIPRINQNAKSKRVTSAKLINAWLRERSQAQSGCDHSVNQREDWNIRCGLEVWMRILLNPDRRAILRKIETE